MLIDNRMHRMLGYRHRCRNRTVDGNPDWQRLRG
jgi:hypothetical protein